MNPASYPKSPTNVPLELAKPAASYKRQATLALLGLSVFMLLFVALTACFIYISVTSFASLSVQFNFYEAIVATISAVLALFMVKSLFAIRKSDDPNGIEVTATSDPQLFEFLNTLADEVGAPRPHRVFLTPEVNAAVFYDLTLLNLFFPSKKNLIIGMGLVNSLNLGELKAVLAHEFGHFAQSSMLVGRWVYIAQQIIGHMVNTYDWLDKAVRLLSRIDIRIAWLGWIMALVIWSIRSIVDTLFTIIIIAERALSREMEFNADLVAVSVSGSDALVHALFKLQAADQAWHTAIDVVQTNLKQSRQIEDVFETQDASVRMLSDIMGDNAFGQSPVPPPLLPETTLSQRSSFRVFNHDLARPPQMWSTHPANRDREDNAKSKYVYWDIDERSAWDVFTDINQTKQLFNKQLFHSSDIDNVSWIDAYDAIQERFNKPWYSPEYKGNYLSREWERNFISIKDLEKGCQLAGSASQSLAGVYPNSLKTDLEMARNLNIEKQTLEGLASGDLKPSGGVIRHRGKELNKNEIPDAIDEVSAQYNEVAMRLKTHDALCRNAHLQAAKELGNNWEAYLRELIKLCISTSHMKAHVENELNLLANTWQIITADGKVGFFEKKRMLRACGQVNTTMVNVARTLSKIELPPTMLEHLKVESWRDVSPKFDLPTPDKINWDKWCVAANERMQNIFDALNFINSLALEELIESEATLFSHIKNSTRPEQAPTPANVPSQYPTLLVGHEYVLERKLDLWNRFQLAHGFFPTLSRFLVSGSIVGGTVIFGLFGPF